jgi:hypothetical protein
MITALRLSLAGFCMVAGVAQAALPPCSEIAVVAGRNPELAVANGYGNFLVRKSGRNVVVLRDGKPVEQARVQREGKIVRVREREDILLQIGVFDGFGGGQLAYTPDLDPASVKRRFGVEVEPSRQRARPAAQS